MAKYCVKCGKPLPDGVEVCSECHTPVKSESDAALFTRMSSETEVWKGSEDDEKKRRRIKKLRRNKLNIILGSGAILLAGLTVFIILFSSPASRVARAINSGNYQRALTIYTENIDPESEHSSGIDKAIVKAGERTCQSYAGREISTEEAAEIFSTLNSFGDYTESLLADSYASYTELKKSQGNFDKAENLFLNGEYLVACDNYLMVIEQDSEYFYAQERATECLDKYADKVLESANGRIGKNEYAAAIVELKGGNDKLYLYGTFSPEIDARLEECYGLYEAYILEESGNLAELKEYGSAVQMIKSCTEGFGYVTDDLLAALDTYSRLAFEKAVDDAVTRANEFYENGEYTEAFAELDAARETLETPEDMDADIEEFEERYTADMIKAADEAFGGVRSKLEAAVRTLETAIEIRPTEELSAHLEEMKTYLPLRLAEAEYSEKSGDIFRNVTGFESLDGTTYDSWIWGEDGASITFPLDGNYDKLEGTFAVRRDDKAYVSASFEVWIDGEFFYSSDKMSHSSDSIPFSIDVGGCNELKIVFSCSYPANAADNGYCYHGLCGLVTLKNIPAA